MMLGVVVVSRLYRDFRAFLCGGEGEGLPGRAANRLAVGKPLVFDARRRHTIFVGDNRFQFATDFGVACNADFARVIGLRIG